MSSPPFALRLTGVSKTFGGLKALDAVDFAVCAGEVHCLAGENGCGKSTLIKIVTGVCPPDPGAGIELFGIRKDRITPGEARDLGIAVIWQDLALFPHMTVAGNIAFDRMVGPVPRPVRMKRARQDAAAVLQRLGVRLDLEARLHTLPIAQRQIVAIARALTGAARLVFMDEPTASLTQSETNGLLDVVRLLASQGVAVVFVSHRLAEVLAISGRVTVLRDGRRVGVFPTAGLTQARLGELMTGVTLNARVNARDRSGADPVLEVRSLTRHGAFEDVSLTIRKGEIVGLTGLVGAGRTELAQALIGMAPPDSGQIRLYGQAIRPANIRQAIAAGIACVPEDRLSLGLVPPQSIADNIAISVIDRLLNRAGLISTRQKKALVADRVSALAIRIGHPDDAVSTLSGGNQQRVVLSKWLATEPGLLILDSPTVGVDVGARAGIFRIVRQLAAQGLAILLISDEVAEVLLNADRVLHMAAGRIVSAYDPHRTGIDELAARVHA